LNPILFLLSDKFVKILFSSRPLTLSIILSLKFKLDSYFKVYKPEISLIQFSWRYKHLRLVRFSMFSILEIALLSMYKTLRPVNSSKFSIYLKPLKCKYRQSLSSGVL
jgi:hypothetical protein